jgi:hypothetical protein
MVEGLIAWGVAAVVLLLAAGVIGAISCKNALGILIDSRGRYSLTQLQIVVWSVVVISLVAGVLWIRLRQGASEPLGFSIPDQLLLVLGISTGSTVTATAVKASKDAAHPEAVSASGPGDPPRLSQIFLLEEGKLADQVVDVTKYQNFWITVLLVAAYVVSAASMIIKAGAASDITALPGFSDTFVILLAVSHAGYLAGKIPNQPGTPDGLTVLRRTEGATPESVAATRSATHSATPPTYVPRNRSK